MIKINFFIGANNKTKKINKEYYNKVIDICSKYFIDYSINRLEGFWNGIKEQSLNVFIYREVINKKLLNNMAIELKQELKQEAILISMEKVKTVVV